MAAVRDEKRIELVLELIRWDQSETHDRLGLDEMVYPILEVQVPLLAHPGQPRAQRQLAHRGRRAQPPAAGARAPLGARVPGAARSRAGRRARAALAGRRRMRLVVVTGVSGAGKSTALRALEDLGFYAVDNLPLPLVPQFIELFGSRTDIDRAALGLDARGGELPGGRLVGVRAPAPGRALGGGALPRRLRRDPHPALLRDAAPAPAVGHRHPRRHRGRAQGAGRSAPARPTPWSTPAR